MVVSIYQNCCQTVYGMYYQLEIVVEDLSESTVESSTLVEIQRLRVLQEPEQRSYSFIMDVDIKGYYITYGKLDCQL